MTGKNKQSKEQRRSRRDEPKRAERTPQPSWWDRSGNQTKVIAGVAVLGILGGLFGVWYSVQQSRDQTRPVVVISAPLALLDSFKCDAVQGQMTTGRLQYSLKNVGGTQAIDVSAMPFASVVPQGQMAQHIEQMRVAPLSSCEVDVALTPIERRLAVGEVFSTVLRQTASTMPAASTDTTFVLVGSVCARYAREDGRRYATCDAFIFRKSDGSTALTCDGQPYTGSFVKSLTGQCST